MVNCYKCGGEMKYEACDTVGKKCMVQMDCIVCKSTAIMWLKRKTDCIDCPLMQKKLAIRKARK